ncbi:MAG TPA: hypothetical protein V6D28_27080 [Leptolyngbyaceae cyanobacterium]
MVVKIGKNQRVIALLLVILSILTISYLPSFAQSERHPTSAEIQKLRQKLRQQIRDIESSGQVTDNRNLAGRQSRESFVRDWSRIDPATAPFLGEWGGYEESLAVYPSNTRGRVCLIYIGIQAADFSLGNISNGVIRTSDREVILKEGEYLGIGVVMNNQPDIPVAVPYHFSTVLQPPREFAKLSAATTQEIEAVVRKFNESGCKIGLPSR